MTDHDAAWERRLTRRALIQRTLGATALLALPAIAAACGSSDDGSSSAASSAAAEPTAPASSSAAATTAASSSSEAASAADSTDASSAAASTEAATSAAAGTPKTGGTLRVATPGAGAKEQINPFKGSTIADINRRFQLFDSLFAAESATASYEPHLAETVTPNEDGTVWTIKLRDGIVDHAGNPLTADDAIYSLQVVTETGNVGSPFAPYMDVKNGIKKVDDLTFELHLDKPLGDLGSISRAESATIAPRGWNADPKKPVGTGPFMFDSFTPGQQSVFKRNPNYWMGDGRPYVDELVIVSIPDATARANALLQGEIDAVENFDFLQANQLKDDERVVLLNSPSEWTTPFMTRFDMDPFKDVRVRQAVKLSVDRQAMVDSVFFGFGVVGNDQFGKNGPSIYYNSDLPQREYDPEAARALLAEAGFPDGIDVTLEIAPGCGCQGPEGVVATAAQLFQQQAKEAGVNFKIHETTNLDQFNLLSFPFSATWWSPGVPYVLNWFTDAEAEGSYNEGWVHPEWDDKFHAALGEVDETKRKELWNELQAEFYDQSGHVIWGHYNLIDGLAPNVQGAYSNSWPLSTYDFKSYWLA